MDMETLIDTLCVMRQNLETRKEAVTSSRDRFTKHGETELEWHTQHGQMLGFEDAIDVVDEFIEEAERRLEE